MLPKSPHLTFHYTKGPAARLLFLSEVFNLKNTYPSLSKTDG